MFKRMLKYIPTSWIVFVWSKIPIPKRIKNFMVWYGNTRFLISVSGIIKNEKDEILLFKHTYRDLPWGIPGGWMEGNHPQLELEREVYEESGFRIELANDAKPTFFSHPNRVDLLFQGRLIGGMFRESAEISEYGFFKPGEWPNGMPENQKKIILLSLRTNV